jgi:hypothetical protein
MWFQGPPARRIVPAGERGKPMNARCEERLPLLNRVHDRLHYLARILGAVGLAQQPAHVTRVMGTFAQLTNVSLIRMSSSFKHRGRSCPFPLSMFAGSSAD